MTWLEPAILFIAAFVASFAATRVALAVLRRIAILDHPNERSLHSAPTPRGGGLAVVAVLVAAWTSVGLDDTGSSREIVAVCLCMVGLGVLSWIDDLRGLPVVLRLCVQAVAVAAALAAMPGRGPFFGGLLVPFLDVVAAGLLWLWFINLFNFMDGIDGIAGTETACVATGVAVVAILAGMDGPLALYAIAAAAAALGFLWWNWHPARIFLGDVGSVPLGFATGWLLLGLAAHGQWAAALILPSYYLADATITLLRRLVRGERVWRAHREHFYQRAVQSGLGHAHVVAAVLAANLLLLTAAGAAALGWPWPALFGSCAVVATLLFYLAAGRGSRPS